MINLSFASLGYLSTVIASVLLLAIYCHVFKEKIRKNAVICFIAVFLTDLGYFLLSVSSELGFALFANRLIYFGSILLINILVTIIAGFCEIKISKMLSLVMIICSILALLLTFTGGSDILLYYSSVQLEVINGTSVLVKEYGKLHDLYLGYVVLTYLFMIALTVYSIIRKGNRMPVNPAAMTFVVLENILVWVFERFTISYFELLSVSYVVNGAVLILLYKNMEDYKMLIEPEERVKKTIKEVIREWEKEYELTEREIEVLGYLLDNVPRNEIAGKMFITEHTVKKHTSHIYEKMNIASRSELLHKLNEYLS